MKLTETETGESKAEVLSFGTNTHANKFYRKRHTNNFVRMKIDKNVFEFNIIIVHI